MPQATGRTAARHTTWLASTYVVLIALIISSTGWIALREGSLRYLKPFLQDVDTSQLADQAQALREAPDLARITAYSPELGTLSRLTSPERFAQSRLVEHGVYLAQMPQLNQVLLTAHIFTGVACVLLGGWQFWPTLRQRQMRLHRLIGGLYLLTVPPSVILSFAYMAVTAPHHLYTHLTAYIALWLVGVVALISVGMAVWSLKQRRIHEHMGWMALSFACLLVAPILRLNWVALAWAFPHIDQETLSLVTMGLMLPECLMIGYGLILANRPPARKPVRAPAPTSARAPRHRPAGALATWGARLFTRGQPLACLGVAAVAATLFTHHVGGLGVASAQAAAALVPAGLLAREAAVMAAHPWLNAAFALSTSAALALAVGVFARLLRPAPPARSPWVAATGLLSLLAGACALALGWAIGLAPERAWSAGGTLYTVPGVLTMGFALHLLRAWQREQHALAKEALVFLMCLLPFAALYHFNLWGLQRVLQWAPWPSDYLAQHQGHILPMGASLVTLFIGLLHAVVGQANREPG